jgi:hypothetical protein
MQSPFRSSGRVACLLCGSDGEILAPFRSSGRVACLLCGSDGEILAPGSSSSSITIPLARISRTSRRCEGKRNQK